MIPEADWICVIGVDVHWYERSLPLLQADTKKRLIFLDIEGIGGSFPNSQVSVLTVSSLQEMLQAAKKIGWKSVFHTLALVGQEKAPEMALQFESAVRKYKEAAHLILSDWADVGETVLKHAFLHWNSLPDVRSGLGLKGRFEGIPAVICGGGPSLKKNLHHLDPEKTLIFAGGAALHQLTVAPHFAASIDRKAPFKMFKQHSFWEVPFFYQSRMNPENFSLLHGEQLYIPDGCYPAEAWLAGLELFDGGWTVGTFLIALAAWLGCDPIICTGMDFCYENECKYGASEKVDSLEGLVSVEDRFGRKTWSQRDWLMAADWIDELAKRRWDKTFIDATEGGLRLARLQEKTLQEVMSSLNCSIDLEAKVHAEVMGLDWMAIPLDRMDEWKRSLKRCLALCKKELKQREPVIWDEEIVYQMLLFPLWQIWSPVFERELEVDSQPLPFEEKLRLNQILFFQRVLYEQAN
ncbi:MAG: DUF115 domain-containing protein [Chlamydiales bacterium]|nr:DUF115 domain-containing protein [Chlamydiales bacterium]